MTNLLLLFAEGALYFGVMVSLFRIRNRFGIGIFFCALGTMHFLETYLAAILYVQLPFGVFISPGSIVLFSGKLLMLLLLYIREDAATVRQPIYGLLLGNFLMVALVMLLRFHAVEPAVPERLPDFRFMDEMGWLMVWGTILLFIDSFLIILLYERSRAWFGGWRTLRIVSSAALVLTFDQVFFFMALRIFVGVPYSVLVGGWIAKMLAAALFGMSTAAYLRWVEPDRSGHERWAQLGEVFDTLTYRQRYEALLKQAGRDGLTGLLDRGRFDREGRVAIGEAVTAKRPVSLLVIDIDHFKTFNDEHGHAVGDEVLRAIARKILSTIRDVDQVYRYGGEEFIVLCDGMPHAAALVAAERLRREIVGIRIAGLDRRITASIGVSTAPDDGIDLTELFTTADHRLYGAKEAGRNRILGRLSQGGDASTEAALAERRQPA